MFHLIPTFRNDPAMQESLHTKQLIHKGRSDNTDLFRDFADETGAIPLTDEVHGHGMKNNVYICWKMDACFRVFGN